MASKSQKYFRELKREIKNMRKDMEYAGEGDRTEVENYWLYLWLNETDSYAEEENLPNWQTIWKPRLVTEINKFIDEYVDYFQIHTDVSQEEPEELVADDDYSGLSIPFEAYGDYEFLVQIANLRGTIYLSIDDLIDDIASFSGYVIAIRKTPEGYQIWVEK